MKIKIKYLNKDLKKIEQIEKGDWIDLRASSLKDPITKEVLDLSTAGSATYEAGAFFLIGLGIAMQLPEGYEAHVAPRGSTFKNFALVQSNSVGVVDESYCGNNDEWFMPVLTCGEGEINFNDRVCQFRIVEKMPKLEFEEVEILNNSDRDGHGSTGIK